MEGSMIDLSKYRFQLAKEDLEAVQLLMKDNSFEASVNRSYYAIFHGLRLLQLWQNLIPVNILE